MTSGPEHYRRAEQLVAEAYKRLGQEGEQSAATWASVAQVHATLAGVAVAMQAQFPVTHRAELAWRDAVGIEEQGEPPVVKGHTEPWAED